jgi:glycine/D-amino acid oxidase-like deaminating enzyme
MSSLDVAIVGAGIVGCACARAAAVAGLKVAVFDAGGIAGGATGAGMGHLVVLDEDPAERALARLSMREMASWPADWRAGAASRGEPPVGTLWLAETPAQQAAALAKRDRLRAADWPAEWVDAATLRALEPALARDLVGALHVPQDDVVYGPGLAFALARDVRARGGRVEVGRAVREVAAGRATLVDGTQVAAGHVLVAAGVGTPALLPGRALPIRPRKGLLAITDRHPGTLRHAVVELGYIDSAAGDAAESIAFNAQPRETGQVLLGSSRQYGVEDAGVDPVLMARMVRRAQRFLPRLGELVLLRTWAGFRPATPDGRPLIGRLDDDESGAPGGAGLWIAAGHEGLGLTTAAGTARVWLDQVLDRAPAIDPSPFAPRRFEGVAA